MIELIADHWQDVILYSTYVKIVVYFLLILSCQMIIVKGFQHHHYEIKDIKPTINNAISASGAVMTFSFLTWFPKTIRRKISSSDETDGPLFFLPSNQTYII